MCINPVRSHLAHGILSASDLLGGTLLPFPSQTIYTTMPDCVYKRNGTVRSEEIRPFSGIVVVAMTMHVQRRR